MWSRLPASSRRSAAAHEHAFSVAQGPQQHMRAPSMRRPSRRSAERLSRDRERDWGGRGTNEFSIACIYIQDLRGAPAYYIHIVPHPGPTRAGDPRTRVRLGCPCSHMQSCSPSTLRLPEKQHTYLTHMARRRTCTLGQRCFLKRCTFGRAAQSTRMSSVPRAPRSKFARVCGALRADRPSKHANLCSALRRALKSALMLAVL